MKASSQLPPLRNVELDIADLTQEIEAPLTDYEHRDEPTLSKVDFDELEIKLDF